MLPKTFLGLLFRDIRHPESCRRLVYLFVSSGILCILARSRDGDERSVIFDLLNIYNRVDSVVDEFCNYISVRMSHV